MIFNPRVMVDKMSEDAERFASVAETKTRFDPELTCRNLVEHFDAEKMERARKHPRVERLRHLWALLSSWEYCLLYYEHRQFFYDLFPYRRF